MRSSFGVWLVGVFSLFLLGGAWLDGAPARELAAREAAWGVALRTGDFVFQDLACGERCDLIRDVTRSPYVHVGVVVAEGGERVVWEAYRPVGPTPLEEWVRRGVSRHVTAYRPPADALPPRRALVSALEGLRGRPYDANYQWDEERIYCSELLYRAFAAAGRPLPTALRRVDLGVHEGRVRALSGGVLTSETRMVTPRDLVELPGWTRLVDELPDAW